jgi:hypothetical protein
MSDRVQQNKPTRPHEYLPERRAECGGGACKGRQKNTTQRVEIFFSLLVYPCKYVFVEQRERLTNILLPAVFNYFNGLLFGFLWS